MRRAEVAISLLAAPPAWSRTNQAVRSSSLSRLPPLSTLLLLPLDSSCAGRAADPSCDVGAVGGCHASIVVRACSGAAATAVFHNETELFAELLIALLHDLL